MEFLLKFNQQSNGTFGRANPHAGRLALWFHRATGILSEAVEAYADGKDLQLDVRVPNKFRPSNTPAYLQPKENPGPAFDPRYVLVGNSEGPWA